MANKKSIFVCQSCGSQAPKWSGRCGDCGQWNTLVEERVGTQKQSSQSPAIRAEVLDRVRDWSDVEDVAVTARAKTGIAELDRVLGGGLVPASLVLLGGEPGIGKSTLLLQLMGSLCSKGLSGLYASGEESAGQIASRARRLKLDPSNGFSLLPTSSFDELELVFAEKKPQVLVLDSIQTFSVENLDSAAGTVGQVREITHRMMRLCKESGCIGVLVGHVTKEGNVAGPKLLEHMVDAVFYFEMSASQGYRLLRAQKNRFGATHEVAVFEMLGTGLVEVPNPSARFLEERAQGTSGSSLISQLEGSRSMITEFQALSMRAHQGYPRRTVQGIDQNRISVLLAVLDRTLDTDFANRDVFCKVASGHFIEDPAADLGVAVALLSSLWQEALPEDAMFLGELGLGGELRSVPGLGARIAEAQGVGVERLFVPQAMLREESAKGAKIKLIGLKNLKEILKWLKPRRVKENDPKAANPVDLNF